MFGTYHPPLVSLSGAASTTVPSASRAVRVPPDVLTDAVIEEVKTRCCFVGPALDFEHEFEAAESSADDSMELDAPPSESGQSATEHDSRTSIEADAESSTGVLSPPSGSSEAFSSSTRAALASRGGRSGEGHLQAIAAVYSRYSTATDLHVRVDPPPSHPPGTGKGTLVVPGWVRERAAEVLFEGGDVDERSVAEVVLDALLRVSLPLLATIFELGLFGLLVGPSRLAQNARIDHSCCRWYADATGFHSATAC